MTKVDLRFIFLPGDILLEILSILPFREILSCASTCRALSELARNSLHLQYIIELGAQGLTVSSNQTSIDEKLGLLKARDHLWDGSASFVLENQNTSCLRRPPEETGGQGRSWISGGFLCYFSLHQQLASIRELRNSNSRPRFSYVWQADDTSPEFDASYHVLNMEIDPSSDLLVIVRGKRSLDSDIWIDRSGHTFIIDLRKISTNEPHPYSAVSSVPCFPYKRLKGDEDNRASLLGLKISGDHIALLSSVAYCDSGYDNDRYKHHFFPVLMVYNWRTGKAANGIVLDHSLIDYHLISGESRFLIVTALLLAVYTYSLEDPIKPPQCQVRYNLPEGNYRPIGFHYSSLPSSKVSKINQKEYIASNFMAHPEAPICVIECEPRYNSPSSPLVPPNVLFVIDSKIFSPAKSKQLRELYLTRISHQSKPKSKRQRKYEKLDQEQRRIPWTVWGPEHSRCFPHHSNCPVAVDGFRMIQAIPLESDPTSDLFHLHLRDFNYRMMSRLGSRQHAIREQSLLPSNEYGFAEDVQTSLMYRDAMSLQQFPRSTDRWPSWMPHHPPALRICLNEDRILMTKDLLTDGCWAVEWLKVTPMTRTAETPQDKA
ncbi:hypothetical protein BJ138DRAFT_1102112 [Hygrophoropsis aurantiaca]|uniref:Uncharacterized protein n=1 Tax=Hygrophoropsis aurantiaca TaxID=72124 RepID=A0ACB8A9R3_9AGAM|nr:hypothetical protein BJ138DRAFT_1102112 [Hygrophoropsis aurantiaca]